MRSLYFLGNGLRCAQIHIVHGKNSNHLCACAVGVPSDSPSNRYATPTQNRTCLIYSPAYAAKLPTWQKPYWESMSLGKSCLNQLAHLAPLPPRPFTSMSTKVNSGSKPPQNHPYLNPCLQLVLPLRLSPNSLIKSTN